MKATGASKIAGNKKQYCSVKEDYSSRQAGGAGGAGEAGGAGGAGEENTSLTEQYWEQEEATQLLDAQWQ